MSTLSNLLRQVEQKDPRLADDLAREVKALGERRGFGLNFERHTPETVELPGRPIRKGDKVRFLAERGASPKSVDQRLWRVISVARTDAGRVATLIRQGPNSDQETTTRAVDDLVVVAEFGDPIYPGLVSTGKVERGGDKPFHTVINAENFHALQALLYTHEARSTPSTSTRPTTPAPATGSTTTTMWTPRTRTDTLSGWRSWSDGCGSRSAY